MRIRGKFRLTSCTQHKAYRYPKKEDGTVDYQGKSVQAPAVQVELNAVAGTQDNDEDSMFGHATPYGSLKMTVANEEAARFLLDQWTEYIKGDDFAQPAFYVDLVKADA